MAERKQQPTIKLETEVLVYKKKRTSRSQIQTQENKKSKYKCKKLNSLNMVLEAKSHVCRNRFEAQRLRIFEYTT